MIYQCYISNHSFISEASGRIQQNEPTLGCARAVANLTRNSTTTPTTSMAEGREEAIAMGEDSMESL